MSETGFQLQGFSLQGFSDPRLAVHAAGALPAWLWAADGSRVLWANPLGAKAFGAASGIALAGRSFGPADSHRRQVAQLAPRLPENGAVRLERLRGFGAPLGTLSTCGCSRLDLPDGSHGVLITTTDTGLRTMPLAERLQRLVDDSEAPLIAFTADGVLAGASLCGRRLLGARDLTDPRLTQARDSALADGQAEAQLDLGRITLYRVGSGDQLGLIAWVRPEGTQPPPQPAPDDMHAGNEPAASTTADALQSDHTGAPDTPDADTMPEGPQHEAAGRNATEPPEPDHSEGSSGAETSGNVVPFRSPGEIKFPALTPVENSAFHELARQLSARLEGDFREAQAEPIAGVETTHMPSVTEPPCEPPRREPDEHPAMDDGAVQPPPDWLAPEAPPPQGESQRDRIVLDLLPGGVLIYRLDRLLYANDAFLSQMGYPNLAALEQAGGLDALYVEPGVPSSSGSSEAGTPVMITTAEGSSNAGCSAAARLFTISWDGDTAHALIFTPRTDATSETAPLASPAPAPLGAAPAPPAAPPLVIAPPPGRADAEDLGAILDVTAEGILMFDAGGNIHACNRSAEALFGYDGAALVRRNLIELFATESTRLVLDYLESVRESGAASVLDQGREVLGRVSQGGLIPLSITIGRTRPDGPNFFAVFRDLSQTRRGESELLQARRLADRAANAKADMLARISHEVRAPLNAIIGFAEVMIGERFGNLGNERYVDYMKDIRSSGERVIALINDLLELSRIETGKLDLAFSNQNLNELVESCVAMMQPHANRARIIIRSSLSHGLPSVVADARALRQITLNLISTSIALANPGGQVIVSTAMSDFGEVVLRLRDTGHGLNDQEVAAALEPFRSHAPSEQAADSAGVSLSLTKALVEANRAQFHIKAAPRSGTLMEVVFSRALARNQGLG
ncbi:sensor histidine kinase [Bradyrhizobium sp. STM 3557]|uniref:sensor histidine kinase n=1 Tax=Bradyrhizobium sp. STM 3557 TaxID=578920 RepID=UPI00388F0E66